MWVWVGYDAFCLRLAGESSTIRAVKINAVVLVGSAKTADLDEGTNAVRVRAGHQLIEIPARIAS